MQTYSEKEPLTTLLEMANQQGSVHIQRDNGQVFVLTPDMPGERSPFDIEGIDLGLTAEEIVEFIHEGRGNDRW